MDENSFDGSGAKKRIRQVASRRIPSVYDSEGISERRRSDVVQTQLVTVKGAEESVASRNRRWRIEEELVRCCIAESMSREQIISMLQTDETGLATIDRRLMATDGIRNHNKSTAQKYYEYTLQQEQCARDLTHISELVLNEADEYRRRYNDYLNDSEGTAKLPPKPALQAAVIAIKARSDIFERSIKLGQDMGLIEKRAKEIRVSGNVNLAALDTEALKDLLSKKLDDMQALVATGKLPKTYRNMLKKVRGNKDGDRLEINRGGQLPAHLRAFEGTELSEDTEPLE